MRVNQILLATLLMVFSITSFAIDYYKATRILYVRSGAGIEYPVSFTLLKGGEVEIVSKNGEWCKIKYFERTGYAYSKHLQYGRTISNSPQRYIIIGTLGVGITCLFNREKITPN